MMKRNKESFKDKNNIYIKPTTTPLVEVVSSLPCHSPPLSSVKIVTSSSSLKTIPSSPVPSSSSSSSSISLSPPSSIKTVPPSSSTLFENMLPSLLELVSSQQLAKSTAKGLGLAEESHIFNRSFKIQDFFNISNLKIDKEIVSSYFEDTISDGKKTNKKSISEKIEIIDLPTPTTIQNFLLGTENDNPDHNTKVNSLIVDFIFWLANTEFLIKCSRYVTDEDFKKDIKVEFGSGLEYAKLFYNYLGTQQLWEGDNRCIPTLCKFTNQKVIIEYERNSGLPCIKTHNWSELYVDQDKSTQLLYSVDKIVFRINLINGKICANIDVNKYSVDDDDDDEDDNDDDDDGDGDDNHNEILPPII